jgi:hypothetical protein
MHPVVCKCRSARNPSRWSTDESITSGMYRHGFTADMGTCFCTPVRSRSCAEYHFGLAVLAVGSKCVIGDFIAQMIRYRSRMD